MYCALCGVLCPLWCTVQNGTDLIITDCPMCVIIPSMQAIKYRSQLTFDKVSLNPTTCTCTSSTFTLLCVMCPSPNPSYYVPLPQSLLLCAPPPIPPVMCPSPNPSCYVPLPQSILLCAPPPIPPVMCPSPNPSCYVPLPQSLLLCAPPPYNQSLCAPDFDLYLSSSDYNASRSSDNVRPMESIKGKGYKHPAWIFRLVFN